LQFGRLALAIDVAERNEIGCIGGGDRCKLTLALVRSIESVFVTSGEECGGRSAVSTPCAAGEFTVAISA